MDFKDSFQQLVSRVASLKEQVTTEEATKNAFIMPFIQMLGYDVFNPLEVRPEMDCDMLKSKGEKIDYAILKNGEPIILIECKHWQQDLSLHDNQLKRYFVASKAKFGILTNGIVYRFYTDLENKNIMDDRPFLEINLEDLRPSLIDELSKFRKDVFDVENILSSASDLTYLSQMKRVIKEEFSEPSRDFVKVLTKKFYDKPITQKTEEQFRDVVKRALKHNIDEIIKEKFKNVIGDGKDQISAPDDVDQENDDEDDARKEPNIETTLEELEGFYIVKGICCEVLGSNRITYKDNQNYFVVMVDNSIRKVICRLYFNNLKHKRIKLVSEDGTKTKYDLDSFDDLYNYKRELIDIARRYV